MCFFRVDLSWFPWLRPVLLYTLFLHWSRGRLYTEHGTSSVLVPHFVPFPRLTLLWHCVAALCHLWAILTLSLQPRGQVPWVQKSCWVLAEGSSVGGGVLVSEEMMHWHIGAQAYVQRLNEKQMNHKTWPNIQRSRYLRHIIPTDL